MKEIDMEKKAADVLRELFETIPFVLSTGISSSQGLPGPDFTISLKLENSDVTILVEAKSSGQPRLARDAVNQLLRFRSERTGCIPGIPRPLHLPLRR